VLHILQEALSNVRKHAGAGKVSLAVHRDADYRFTIRDDGHGFDVTAAAAASDGHIGLRIMQERAQRIGGRIEVRSGAGGTTVTLILPVIQAAEQAAVRPHGVPA
jgi:two-component system nitrate/nitrite sensor histidine kinase NarX